MNSGDRGRSASSRGPCASGSIPVPRIRDALLKSTPRRIFFRHVHAHGNFLCRRVNGEKLVLRGLGQLSELGPSRFQSLNKSPPQNTAIGKPLKDVVFAIHRKHPFRVARIGNPILRGTGRLPRDRWRCLSLRDSTEPLANRKRSC